MGWGGFSYERRRYTQGAGGKELNQGVLLGMERRRMFCVGMNEFLSGEV